MHLTNYAVNKKSPNFVFNENENNDDVGHKRSFSSVLKVCNLIIWYPWNIVIQGKDFTN